MQTPRLGLGLAALTMGAVASFGMAAPALAQTAPGPVVYPPTSSPAPTGPGASISDRTVVAGQTVTVNTGAGTFDAGTEVSFETSYGVSGTVTANAAGAAVATFTIPTGLAPGRYSIEFSGVLNGQATTESASFEVSVAAAPAVSPGEGMLPRTGSQEAVPIAAAGIALVAAGAGMVVVARRRRSELDGSIA